MDLRISINPGKFTSWKEHQYQVNRRMVDPQSATGIFEWKIPLLLPERKLLVFQSVA